MNALQLTSLLPLIILAAASVVVILAIAWRRDHGFTAVLTLAGLALTIASLPAISDRAPVDITPLIRIDHFSLYLIGLICISSFIVAVLSYSYFSKHSGSHEEFYLLLLLAALGTCVLSSSIHFASFFLGLEILSISLYAMTAYLRHSDRSVEAGVKYLILAAVSSAFILFGMALVYAETGNMKFPEIASKAAGADPMELPFTAGIVMIISGLGFKLALAPFHMWTPDVYEGAPAPVTAFIATISKGGVFALSIRFLQGIDQDSSPNLFEVLSVISVVSMFTGNLLALLQTNVKRILAYSSISHLGYLLVALLATGPLRITASLFYLTAYMVTMLGALGVVTLLSGKERDADAMDDYAGLAWRRPWLGAVFTAMLLSLAGIPLTAGFIGKFYIAAAGVGSALWLLVVILIINSAIGLFYYLRIIAAVFSPPKETLLPEQTVSRPDIAVLTGLMIALLWLGVYPAPLLSLIETTLLLK